MPDLIIPEPVIIYRGDTILSECLATIEKELIQRRGENNRVTQSSKYNVKVFQNLSEFGNTYLPFVNDTIEIRSGLRSGDRLIVEGYKEDVYKRFFDIKCSDAVEYFNNERTIPSVLPIRLTNATNNTEVIYNYGQIAQQSNVSVSTLPFIEVTFYDTERQIVNYVFYQQLDKFRINLIMEEGVTFSGTVLIQSLR